MRTEETNIFLHFDMKFGSYGFIDIRKKKFQPPPLLKGGGGRTLKIGTKGGDRTFSLKGGESFKGSAVLKRGGGWPGWYIFLHFLGTYIKN